MIPTTKFICQNINRTKLTPLDLLSDGIIEAKFLEQCHPCLYRDLSSRGFLEEIQLYEINKVNLSIEEKKFIKDFIHHGYASIPSVRRDAGKFFASLSSFLTRLQTVWSQGSYMSNNVKERSYSHQVVHPICDLLLYGIPNIDQEFDGEAQSTKNRNGGFSGPDRHSDVMMSRIYDQLKAEMLFVEISYGPYSRDENHYRDDKVRLGKFSKDAWRHIQTYFGQFKCPETLRRLDELEHFSIHFHGTRMDVYVSDRKLAPFHRMCLIRSLEIPLTNEDPSSTIKAVTEPNNSTL